MASESSAQPISASPQLIASPLHCLLMVAIVTLNAYRGIRSAALARAGLGPSRTQLYLRTILIELVLLGIVIIGVRLRGASWRTIFGPRWNSAAQVFGDLGLGLLLLLTSTVVVSMLSGHRDSGAADLSIGYLLPQTFREILLWLALSFVAGVCEEALFRAYFQVQFAAMTHSVPAGTLISAAMFGAGHAYQGWGRALVIGATAVLFGGFAHWRGTVRPGMFAHTLQDAVAPLLIKLMRH